MHPLSDNLKNVSFEELEKRKSEIHKRMQIMRRNQIHTPEIWHQLEAMLSSIQDEQSERYMQQNAQTRNSHKSGVVMVTDPLEEDLVNQKESAISRTFRPVQ